MTRLARCTARKPPGCWPDKKKGDRHRHHLLYHVGTPINLEQVLINRCSPLYNIVVKWKKKVDLEWLTRNTIEHSIVFNLFVFITIRNYAQLLGPSLVIWPEMLHFKIVVTYFSKKFQLCQKFSGIPGFSDLPCFSDCCILHCIHKKPY